MKRFPLFLGCALLSLGAVAGDPAAPVTPAVSAAPAAPAAAPVVSAIPVPSIGSVDPVARTLLETTVSGDDSKRAVTVMVEWPVGAATGLHTHAGDEYAIVTKGELEVKTATGTRNYKVGESYHNPRGVAHETRMIGAEPAQSVGVLVIDQSAPLWQPVK